MRGYSINERIVRAIKQSLSENDTISNVLMDLLSLSKESVYRRLRNEIPFTLDELVKITNRFGISIDDIIDSGSITTKWATLNVDKFYQPENYMKQYQSRLSEHLKLFLEMQSAKKASIRCAYNIVPYIFLLSYRKLTLFWHYRWNFLMKGANPNFLFSNMIVPDEIIELEEQTIKEVRKIPTTFIFDKNVIANIVNDIHYFIAQQLISQSEQQQLKQELLDLIAEIELVTETGCFKNGADTTIYLSKTSIESCYHYMECDNRNFSFQRIFYIERLELNNAKFCKMQKEWIDLLKRLSILLTQSGDKQRFDFFDTQRKLVKTLG